MLVRILLAAILAGVLSGVFVSAAQSYRVTPLILMAETYEANDHTHAPDTPAVHPHEAGEPGGDKITTPASDAGPAEPWAPENGWERTFFTMLANMLVGVSFSLIVTAGVLATNSAINVQSGLVWGLGGFIAFTLAPNFGLPPELPGMVAGDLEERQTWWLVTVVLAIAALLIFAFKQQIVWMLAGLVMLIAPHIYGAPVPATHESPVPANLAAEFVMTTLVTSFLFWLLLGGLLGFLIDNIKRSYQND